MSLPLFSICHTSARPDKWRAVYDEWMSKAVFPKDVEYVLCIDPRWGFSLNPDDYASELDNIMVVQNTGRRCYVDGVNIAAKASTGAILIVNADDQFPCERWDVEILQRLAASPRNHDLGGVSYTYAMMYKGEAPFVVDVNTGTPDESARKIMVMPILSRARYEQLGGEVFYHGYESMCADNDFCEHAIQDKVVIEARHLYFPHKHPLYGSDGKWKAPNPETWDVAYQVQNRQEASAQGMELLKRRRASAFRLRRTIALCLAGERFQGPWVDGLLTLFDHLVCKLDFDVLRLRQFAYTTNVYMTREQVRKHIMEANPRPDLCLFLDDDNILTPAHFDKLLADLDERSDVDGVSAWCWLHNEDKAGFRPSCGLWAPDGLRWDPFPAEFAKERKPREFDCGGLPCILMRFSALEKAGEGAFLPILDDRLDYGIMGEDFAFFKRAGDGGAKFLVDPTVRIPHLKYVTVEPVFPDEGSPTPVKVACMMRVKNEARWIKRTIDSVRELCGDLIFVMEDGSTDDTRAVAEKAGAIVLDSPFLGQGFHEGRDKDWLLQEVIERCHPDWIFMPDGDEELEPEGCKKIRQVLETNPDVDCYALRFLYFWDTLDQIRVDGNYGRLARQSLFRARTDFRFRSIYEGEGANPNHVGLHCSNAPGLGGKLAHLNVALLHYGYMHKEDRIRKFRWISELDPNNEMEGFYLHCVQGDLPEVPPEAKLKHAGPLRIQKLTRRLVPQGFDSVPGPIPADDEEELRKARELAARRMPSLVGNSEESARACSKALDLLYSKD